jgi:hypothetical protein
MDAKDYLYYGFGQIVFGLAFSDGEVQIEEKKRLEEIIDNHFLKDTDGSRVSSIIFQLLDKNTTFSVDEIYEQGVKNIKLGDHYLTPELLEKFKSVLQNIADAFPPSTEEELEIIRKFSNDIKCN